MNILFLTSRVPCRPIGGIQLRVFNFIRVLSRRHKITLISLADRRVPPGELQELKRYTHRIEIIELPRLQSYWNSVKGLFSAKPLQIHYYESPVLRQRLRNLLATQKFDLVYFHLIRVAEYAGLLNGEAKILDLTDAMSLNYERTCQIHQYHSPRPFHFAQKIEKRRLRQYEAAVIERFDRNLIVSQADKNFIDQFADASSIDVIGQGVNLDYFRFYNGAYDPNEIVFLGTMSFLPNIDAVLYFHRTIWPLIKQRNPQMRWKIVGANPTAEILKLRKHPDIEVTGSVPDIRPHLHHAAVSICPMRVGSGVKGKVFESMALGTPVVSTTLGIEGLDVQRGREIFVADDPEEFAHYVCLLSQSAEHRARLARQARSLIEAKYSWDLAIRPLEKIVESFERRNGGRRRRHAASRIVNAV